MTQPTLIELSSCAVSKAAERQGRFILYAYMASYESVLRRIPLCLSRMRIAVEFGAALINKFLPWIWKLYLPLLHVSIILPGVFSHRTQIFACENCSIGIIAVQTDLIAISQ